jgi:hypothetical protein
MGRAFLLPGNCDILGNSRHKSEDTQFSISFRLWLRTPAVFFIAKQPKIKAASARTRCASIYLKAAREKKIHTPVCVGACEWTCALRGEIAFIFALLFIDGVAR